MATKFTKESFLQLWKDELLPSIHKKIQEELKPILKDINDVKGKCDEIEKSQKFLADQYDSIMTLLQTTKKQISGLEQSMNQNKTKIDQLEKLSNDQNAIIDDLQQYIRRDCIEVTGVPLSPDVNAKQIIVEIGQLMGMELTEHHVSIAHPLPATKNIKNRLIAKFVHRDVKDEFYKKRKMIAAKTTKDLPSAARNGPINQKIYINESLTANRRKLFGIMNAFKKEHHYKYLWTVNGKILLRESDSSKIHGFTRLDEFNNFVKNQ